MRCIRIREFLSAYIDDMADLNETQMITEHIEHCIWCRRELEHLKYCQNILKRLEEPELPDGFTIDLHRKLMKER